MDISVIIVNWNVKDILRVCLHSIYNQTKGIDFEVIVVDNASTDGSVEMIRSEFSQVKLIENNKNRGFAAANNQGMTAALGRYFLILNPDTVILDNAIAKTVSFADKHQEAAVVTCKVKDQDGKLQKNCFMYPFLLNLLLWATYLNKLFPQNKFFGRERMGWWGYDSIKEVEAVTGCFMLIRKKAVEEVGMMDESFFIYGEETDLCYRFNRAGWKVIFAPVGTVLHYGKESTSQADVIKIRMQYVLSELLFIKKHKNFLAYSLACSLFRLSSLLRIPFWLGRALISKKRRAEALLNLKFYLTVSFYTWQNDKIFLTQ